MCTLCVEVQKQRMTRREVARAYREFEVPEGHLPELMVTIEKSYGLDEVAKELSELYVEDLTKGIP